MSGAVSIAATASAQSPRGAAAGGESPSAAVAGAESPSSAAAAPPAAVGAAAPPAAARLLVLAPLAIEARAVRAGLPRARVERTGMGARRSRRAVERLRARAEGSAVAVAGFCGALDPALRPGDLVVASELRGAAGTRPCPAAGALVDALRRRGLDPRCGPLVSSERPVTGPARADLAAAGAIAVDMESAWLAAAAGPRPIAVLRAVVDTPARELRAAVATATGGVRAYRSLARAAPALADWASAVAAGPPAGAHFMSPYPRKEE